MKKNIIIIGLGLFFVFAGAGRLCAAVQPGTREASVSDDDYFKGMLAENAQLPIDEAMANVREILFASAVLLPKSGEVKPLENGKQNVSLLTAPDKYGKAWFYAYTDEQELLKVFPEGVPYVKMNFREFVHSIQDKEDVGGVFLNSGSDESAFPVPAEFLQNQAP